MMDSDQTSGYRFSYQLFQEGDLVKEETLEATSVTIGRAPSNVIVLDDEAVSDLHAVVKLNSDHTLILTDLGSERGTFIDDEPVDVRTELEPGSVVRIGPFTLQFFLEVFEDQVSDQPPLESESEAPLETATRDLISLIFESWNRRDDSGVDDVRARKVLEIYEIWGDKILSVQQYPTKSCQVVVGADSRKRHLDYVVAIEDLAVKPSYVLVKARGRSLYLRFSDSQEGELFLNGKRMTLAEAIRSGEAGASGLPGLYQVPLSEDSRFVVTIGPLTFVGGFCYPARRPAAAGRMDIDTSFVTLLLVIAMLFGSSTAYMMTLPPPPKMDLNQIPDRFAKLIIPKKLEKKEPIEKKEIRATTKVEKKAPKEEKKSTKRDDSKIKKKYDKVAIDKAAMDKKIAERSGLLGELGSGGGSKGLFGEGLGAGVISGVAGLLGTTGTSSIAGAPAGSRGLGFGGGGTAGGIGGVGTKGGGGGGGGGGYGNVTRKKKKTYADINVSGGNAVVLGALDKALIDKVIRDHLNAIRYCYQRELVRNPRLAGKVTVKFTIAGNGTVSQSTIKESTMGSVSVEKCINQRIQQLRFPEPRGGGIVIVSYPFFFKAAG